MFFAFLAFQGEFDASIFSKRYRDNFDLNTMTFRCLHGSKNISIDDIDDGICNCCDGSDEVFQNDFACKNTCRIRLSDSDIKFLKIQYNKGIVNRIALGQESAQKYDDYVLEHNKTVARREELKKKLEVDEAAESKAKAELRKWVYETNDLAEPTQEEAEAQMEEYINRVENIIYETDDIEDEEEGEYISAPKIDIKAVEEQKRNRKNKWIYMKEREYADLLNKAVEKSKKSANKGKQNEFLSRLLQNSVVENPPIYQAWLDAKKALDETSKEYDKANSDIYIQNQRLSMNYGEENEWFGSFRKVLEGKMSDSSSRLILVMMQKATLHIPSTGCKNLQDYGNYKKMNGNLAVFEQDPTSAQLSKRTIQTRFVCYPESVILAAYQNTVTNIEAIVGTPEVCPVEFNSDEFNDWLREVQFYIDGLLDLDIFESL